MKNLQEYIEESLLDDEDDLLSASDEVVSKLNTIGSKYNIFYIEDYELVDKIDKSKLKNYTTPYNYPKFDAYKNKRLKKSNKIEATICNILLGMKLDSMDEEEYGGDYGVDGSGNEIYEFFQDIFEKHMNKNKFEILCVSCQRSRIGGRFFIIVELGQASYIKICLREKINAVG